MSFIKQRRRITMQPMGNMNNVARRPSVANRGKQFTDPAASGDDSLSADAELGEYNNTGLDRHIVQMADNNPDASMADLMDAVDYAEGQANQWTDLDVWD